MVELIIPLSSWQGLQGMALLLLIALVLDAIFGDPAVLYEKVPHPTELIARLIFWLEEQFFDADDSPQVQKMAGVGLALITLLAVLSLVALVGVLIAWIPIGGIFLAAFASTLFAGRVLYDQIKIAAKGLKTDAYAVREALEMATGRDIDDRDEQALARISLETLGIKLVTSVVGPAFWFLVLGLPGLAAYKTIEVMDRMLKEDPIRYEHFGRAAHLLNEWINWPAARASAGLICLSAFILPGCDGKSAFQIMRRDAGLHVHLNWGWPMAAIAGALNIALAGPRPGLESTQSDAWVGEGQAEVGVDHINLGLMVYLGAIGIVCALAIVIVLL